MRARFFWIIFSVLTIVTVGATVLHNQLIRNDRLAQLDVQVRETARTLLKSDLNRLDQVEFQQVDKILSAELRDSRIGKLVLIRDESGKVLFQTIGVQLFPLVDIPLTPEWLTLHEKGWLVRVLNVPMPNFPKRTLQVGIVVDEALISPGYFTPGNALFLACIFALGLATAWVLTSTLLQPISELVQFISGISPESGLALPALPQNLERMANSERNDELRQLLGSFSGLIEKVNRGYKMSRVWSYQMAHELKTPLAIIEGEVSGARKRNEVSANVAEKLLREVMAASETVTAFLTWAELEGSSKHKNIYALSVRSLLTGVEHRLHSHFGGRLHLNLGSDFYVFANPQHLEHLLLNLISNALLYSPQGSPVEVRVSGPNTLSILDRGPGLPRHVLDRMGEPFNKGDSPRNDLTHGHGVGIAYVRSVCRLYHWDLGVRSTWNGTEVTLKFTAPAEETAEEALEAPAPHSPAPSVQA